MTLSMFDQRIFEFRCSCGEVRKEILSNFDSDRATCPKCGMVTDLTKEPWRSQLLRERDTASELDKQARKRGEVVERFK